MPKALSAEEREIIQKRLLQAAEDCLGQYGLRKTTVDELVARARIPKGTFYLFYPSKELLFFEVFIKFHERIQGDFLRSIEKLQGEVGPEELTNAIIQTYREVEKSFFFRFMFSGELELLFRKLPPEAHAQHHQTDALSVSRLVMLLPGISQEKAQLYAAALRAVFASLLFKQEIGEEHFDQAIEIMIRGIVLQMFEGGKQ